MTFPNQSGRSAFPPLLFLALALVFPFLSPAQQASPAPAKPDAPASATTPEFLATADEVLHDMSLITGWDLKTPLKKSIRTRAEIRAYVLREMNDAKDAKERYASTRSAEAFGLLPKGFDLDSFLVDLLTEQIAGLYDPKAHEFYIADWIAPEDQRMVMSHELTHALEDQHFQIESWVKAARPNDDAEMAREAVLEGSAMAAMLEYELKDKGIKLQDLPDFDPSIFVGDLADTPMLKKAPPFIKDSLLFPYLNGLMFSRAVLKESGWPGFSSVFARPPVSTQQIMQPELYFANKAPVPVKVDLPPSIPGDDWVLLEESLLGELGWKEVLQQFLDRSRAETTASAWVGDDYATFEEKSSKRLLLFARIRLADSDSTAHFFNQYSEALEKKYPNRTLLNQRSNFLSFETADGLIYLRCESDECISLEGGTSGMFLQWIAKLGWPLLPKSPRKSNPAQIQTSRAFPRAEAGAFLPN